MKSSPFFMKLSTDCLTPWHTGIRAELTIIIPTLLMNCVKPSPRAVMVPNCPSRAISRPNRPMNIPNWTQGLEVILLARRKQTLTASLKDVSDYKERDIIIKITIGLELTTFILVASPSMATSMTWPSSVLLISWKAEPRLLRWPWATLSSSKVVPGERNMRIWQWHHKCTVESCVTCEQVMDWVDGVDLDPRLCLDWVRHSWFLYVSGQKKIFLF